MPESWSEPLEQRFDRLMSSGRQLVNGVSGGRPGSRGAGRRPKFDGLGRWVENKLDWILEDEDDFREPWQEPQPRQEAQPRQQNQPVSQRRRPLEAISRRTSTSSTSTSTTSNRTTASDWPDDETFTVPRWQRQAPGPAPAPNEAPGSGRALPRSTRRRAAD